MRFYGVNELSSFITMCDVVGGFHPPLLYKDELKRFLAERNINLSVCACDVNYNHNMILINVVHKGVKHTIEMRKE